MVRYILALCFCIITGNIVNAGEADVYSMVVGNEIWELSETRQLTTRTDGNVGIAMLSPDGKYVAYLSFDEPGKTIRFCTVKSSGGRPGVIMESKIDMDVTDSEEVLFGKNIWIPFSNVSDSPFSWSPDGRLIAVPAEHIFFSKSGSLDEVWMLTYTQSGIRQKSFLIPTESELSGPILWSPDAHKFATVCRNDPRRLSGQSVPQDISNRHAKYNILVFDAVRGSMQTAVSDADKPPDLERWSSDGKALRYLVDRQLWEVRLDGKPGRMISEDYKYDENSPDGTLQLIMDRPGINVKKCATGEVVEIAKSPNARFCGWTPDGKMIVYRRNEAVSDEQNLKRKPLSSLWLASAETHKLSHMCLALDSEEHQAPTWSNDCMKVAYLYRNRIYLSELTKRPLSPDWKLENGLPLSEEEEKNMLLANAKQIGTGLAMYQSDWDGNYPSADNFQQELYPYLRNSNVFFRPGTEQVVFRYFPPNMLPITDYAGTVVGEMDVGYGWKVVLYADGHVKIIKK